MPRRWGLGPVFVYESLLSARRWHNYALRSGFVALLLIGFLIVWAITIAEAPSSARGQTTFQEASEVGVYVFYALAGIQLSVILLAAPAATAGSIYADRAGGALQHMLATDLSDVEIVLGKLGARLSPILCVIACAAPVAALGGLLGGIEYESLLGAFAVSASLALVGCALALTISVWAAKTQDVLMAVYAIEIIGLLALPTWSGVSRSMGGPPSPPWFQKANPFVLVFAPYTAPGFVGVEDFAAFVLGALCLSCVLLGISCANMRRVVIAQTGRGAGVAHRPQRRLVQQLFPSWTGPQLDGNPVLWREWHRNRPSRLARRLWALLFLTTWGLAAWGTYDLVRNGVTLGPNALTYGFLFQVMFGLLMLSATAPTALAEERARGSLDVLLATPLATRTIVAGKWWGAYRWVLVLALLPAFANVFLAASAPDTPSYPGAARLPQPLQPVTAADRVLACGFSVADFLASSAVIVSLGLLLATWIRRQSRAVAISVVAYVVMAIGWLIVAQIGLRLLMILAQQQFPTTNTWLTERRWITTVVVSLSPVAGPISPIESLTSLWWEPRTPFWIATGVVVAFKSALALGLFWLTVRTFDRCFDRMPEGPSQDLARGAQLAPLEAVPASVA